jgi:hypothetical protein
VESPLASEEDKVDITKSNVFVNELISSKDNLKLPAISINSRDRVAIRAFVSTNNPAESLQTLDKLCIQEPRASCVGSSVNEMV